MGENTLLNLMKSSSSRPEIVDVYSLLWTPLRLGAQWYIAVGNLFDKARIGVAEHDMEVLYSVYRFQ